MSIKYIMKTLILIGINYKNTDIELKGGINDVNNMENILKSKYFYNNIIRITENDIMPTKNNIIEQLSNTINESNNYDELFIYYSGHGTCIKDDNKDEEDGYDEAIVPLDYKMNGLIQDDQLIEIINKTQCKTKVIFDCCHSGSGLDLYNTLIFKNKKFINAFEQVNKNQTNFEIYMLSGCMDNQVSMELTNKDNSVGALTTFFLEILSENNYRISIGDLLIKLGSKLGERKLKQTPVFSSNISINMDTLFMNIRKKSLSIDTSNMIPNFSIQQHLTNPLKNQSPPKLQSPKSQQIIPKLQTPKSQQKLQQIIPITQSKRFIPIFNKVNKVNKSVIKQHVNISTKKIYNKTKNIFIPILNQIKETNNTKNIKNNILKLTIKFKLNFY